MQFSLWHVCSLVVFWQVLALLGFSGVVFSRVSLGHDKDFLIKIQCKKSQ